MSDATSPQAASAPAAVGGGGGTAGADPSRATPAARNPGPSWGYRFMRLCDRVVPEVIFRPMRQIGTWVALATMPAQRRHSRAYLATVLGREPRLGEVFAHFFAFTESLLLKLRVGYGREHRCDLAPEAHAFREWLDRERRVLLGTFHVGHSDLLGFVLGGREQRRVHLVRLRVGNSHDTEVLGARFGDWVRFVWVNRPEELLFSLKAAAGEDGVIALQCDRLEFSARTEAFEFLGARRQFPFTIYHLALIFERPVILCYGVPAGPGQSVLHASPWFEPRAHEGETKAAALARARAHFQEFLQKLEAHLRADPFQWHNFLPLNPPASSDPIPASRPAAPSPRRAPPGARP